MSNEVLDFDVDIDIEAIRTAATEAIKKFREIEKVSSEMGDAISDDMKEAFTTSKEEASKYAKAYKSHLSKIEKDTEQASKKQIEDLKKPFDETRKKFDSLETAAGALGLPFAGIFGSLRDINGSLGDSIEVGGKAGASFLSWSIGIGAAVAGVALIGAGIVGAVAAADDLARELEDYNKIPGFGVSKEDLASIDEANAAFQGITDIASNLVVQFASYVAPAVATVTKGIIDLYFQAQNAFTWISTYTQYIAGVFYDTLKPAISVISEAFTGIKNTVASVFDNVRKSILDSLKTVFEYISKIPGMGYLKSAFDGIAESLSSVKVETIDVGKATESLMGVARKRSKENSDWYKKEKDELKDLTAAKEKALENTLLARYTNNLEESVTKQKEFFKGIEEYADLAADGYKYLYDIQKQVMDLKPSKADFAPTPVEYDTSVPEFKEEPSWFSKAGGVASSIMKGFGAAFGAAGQIYGVFQKLAGMSAESVTEQVESVVSTFTAVADNLPKIIDALVKALPPAIPKIAEALSSVFTYLATDGIDTMIDLGLSLVEGIMDALPELIPQLIMAGAKLVEGIIGALPQLIGALVLALPVIIEGIVKGLVAVVVDLMAKLLDALGLDKAAQKLTGISESLIGVTTPPTQATGSSIYGTTQSSGYRADITSTDSYIPGGSSKTIKTTEGDAAMVYQSGGENDPSRILRSHTSLFVAMVGELKELNKNFKENNARRTNNFGSYNPALRKN